MKYIRKCRSCGASVTNNHQTIKHERELYVNVDGVWEHKKLAFQVRGLGHWSCVNGCQKRHASVTRFLGCGKEQERNRFESVHVERDIVVNTNLSRAASA